ncbi:MAG: hypothetical protein CBC32_013380 [Proteobacteria bacterium TMED72]|nr:MAG: hypothetical protein CBC32_013380 [Proteobacteria bacterium TMED72]
MTRARSISSSSGHRSPETIRKSPGSHPEVIRMALDHAFDDRGDVTIVRRDGTEVEGYLFDRRSARTLDASMARVMPTDPTLGRIEIASPDISELRFSGRDPAAGKSWENWVRRFAEKKLAGEEASIESDRLD